MSTIAAHLPTTGAAGQSGWRRHVGLAGAVLLGLIFLISGGWKVLNPFLTGELLEQAKVPSGWGRLGASVLGTLELFTAFLLFTPRYRRWGGLLGSGLLIFFMCWVGFYYSSLAGAECKCFPFIKRTVGPGFFISDGLMLLCGVAASLWSPAVGALRSALAALGLLVLVAATSYGIQARSHAGITAPSPIVVDGKPQSIAEGNVFLFFYDPSCMHCDAAAKFMSTLNWGDTRVVAIPTVDPQFARAFLRDTGLKAGTSLEANRLRAVFQFGDPPYGVALVDGRQRASFTSTQFTAPQPGPELKKLGFVR